MKVAEDKAATLRERKCGREKGICVCGWGEGGEFCFKGKRKRRQTRVCKGA